MRVRNWVGKALGLAAVGVALAIVLARIGGVVSERLHYQEEARRSVREALAEGQTVIGPLMQRRCVERWEQVEEDDKGRTRRTAQESWRVLSALPAQLNVDGELLPEGRYRGLFKVNTYVGRLQLKADWKDAQELQAPAPRRGGQVQCEDARLLLGVSDARGLRSVGIALDGQTLSAQPGSGLFEQALPAAGEGVAAAVGRRMTQGFHVNLPQLNLAGAHKLELRLDLVGTEQFAWVPAAAEMRMGLRSSWPHVSYDGRFLPVQRESEAKGFNAEWRVSALATTAGAELANGRFPGDTLSLALIEPINPYSLSDRAVKYAILFIALVFVAVGLVEVMGALRVHPVQYLLVGLAMGLFFLLLLALSEHLDFARAYALAATASSALLAAYAASLFKRWRAGALFGAGIGLLYGALYATLNLEQTALLMGSLLLFGALAAVMYATRRIDWYRLGNQAE